MRWLRRFFYSDDPEIKVAGGLSEMQAKMLRELLAKNGIPTLIKNMNFLSVAYEVGPGPADYDMWVKRSDLAHAREILAEVLGPEQLRVDGGG